MEGRLQIFRKAWKGYLALLTLSLLLLLKLLFAQAKMLEDIKSFEAVFRLSYLEKKGARYKLHFSRQGENYYCLSTDAVCKNWKAGDVFWIEGELHPISGPTSPDQFNFRAYLQNQNIVARLQWKRIAKIKSKPNSKDRLINYRNSLARRIDLWPWADKHKALYKALFLGLKGDIDPEMRKDFGAAGLMHLLAVSGLHLGMIYLMIQFLLKPLKAVPYFRILNCALSIVGIWAFSFISGAGPSVLRAATLFSFLAIGKAINRAGSGFSAVWASALILLWFQPLLIRQLGFLLSYSAVIGILFLVPKMKSWHSFKFQPLKSIQELIYVSIAAQLFTAPITLYAFGSFPLYFLLANLLVLPLMSIIMYSGLLVLLLDQFPILSFYRNNFPIALEYMSKISAWISSFPNAQIQWNISLFNCVLSYILLAYWLIHSRLSLKKLIALTMCFGIISYSQSLYQKIMTPLSLVIYSGNDRALVYKTGSTEYHLKAGQICNPQQKLKSLPYVDQNLKIKEENGKMVINSPLSLNGLILVNDQSRMEIKDSTQIVYTGFSPEKEKAWQSYCQALNISFRSCRKGYLEIP